MFASSIVVRSSVPKLDIDDVFEQKNEIAKAVEDELEKVNCDDAFSLKPYVYAMQWRYGAVSNAYVQSSESF